jgi:hypothetical protein
MAATAEESTPPDMATAMVVESDMMNDVALLSASALRESRVHNRSDAGN